MIDSNGHRKEACLEGSYRSRKAVAQAYCVNLFFTAEICLKKALFAAISAFVITRILILINNENKIEAMRIITG